MILGPSALGCGCMHVMLRAVLPSCGLASRSARRSSSGSQTRHRMHSPFRCMGQWCRPRLCPPPPTSIDHGCAPTQDCTAISTPYPPLACLSCAHSTLAPFHPKCIPNQHPRHAPHSCCALCRVGCRPSFVHVRTACTATPLPRSLSALQPCGNPRQTGRLPVNSAEGGALLMAVSFG